MLVVSPLGSNKDGNNGGAMEANYSIGPEDFSNFSGANLLDSIDFDELFIGMHDEDILPDLEMDPELLAEFSLSNTCCGGDESSDINNSSSVISVENNNGVSLNSNGGNVIGLLDANNDGALSQLSYVQKEQQIYCRKVAAEDLVENNKDVTEESTISMSTSSSKENGEKGKKASSNPKSSNSNTNSNNNQTKRKTKVDWTPELHRRFVQAVEQLGVDKAVPSRILELMGIDCLTRHNIASHLQKYRSHRKHLLAREAEAANWSQKRQMYGVTIGGGKGGAPWYPPTMGFPPVTTSHISFRPLHVWGHPTMDPQSRMPMWPKPIVPSTTHVPPSWPPLSPHHLPVNTSFWHSSHHSRVGAAQVPGISTHKIFRPNQHGFPPQPPSQSTVSHPPLELHPSKESIDAAIGEILAKPWQPLPIGLKPPSMDSVMVELQRQGIPKIPPSSCG